MQRRVLIEQIIRLIGNGPVNDDFPITDNLVNLYISEGIALAARQNYKENDSLEGISYVNNSFYSNFSDLPITFDSRFIWKVALPEIPVGVGYNMGISKVRLTDDRGNVTYSLIPLTENQTTYFDTMRPIQNKTLCYYEGGNLYIKSALVLSVYTAGVTMISGGDSIDLTSELNIPPDYVPMVVEYCMNKLVPELKQPQEKANDGAFQV